MRSPDRLYCDNAERPPCDKDGRITLKLNYGKIPKRESIAAQETGRPRFRERPFRSDAWLSCAGSGELAPEVES
jgi:hypothetical protein